MPLARRMALLDTARSAGAIVLEDDYDSEFLFSGRPVAALHGLAEEGRVIYLGTFSKSLMPGLRIAYCVVPVTLVEPFTQLMRNVGCAANVQAQVALAQFMDCGAYQKHLKQIRHIYRERGEMLVEALRRRLGNRIRVELPTGNVQVALSFRERIDDVGLALAMQNFGFAVSPLSNCYSGEDRTSGLIIGFAGATAEQISQGGRHPGRSSRAVCVLDPHAFHEQLEHLNGRVGVLDRVVDPCVPDTFALFFGQFGRGQKDRNSLPVPADAFGHVFQIVMDDLAVDDENDVRVLEREAALYQLIF
ncbi:PLP-dependent aminotransferase family protein [Roseibium salinum]|nr:PLP-dependent aminotransferase family protein [Roseibium salinum]